MFVHLVEEIFEDGGREAPVLKAPKHGGGHVKPAPNLSLGQAVTELGQVVHGGSVLLQCVFPVQIHHLTKLKKGANKGGDQGGRTSQPSLGHSIKGLVKLVESGEFLGRL